MKKGKSASKKTKTTKTSTGSKAKNKVTKKIIAKKPSPKNTSKKQISKNKRVVSNKKTAKSNKANKNNFMVIFLLVSFVVGLVSFVLFIYPAIALRLSSVEEKMVLSETSYSNNTYNVSEDDLLMFATLAYETPSKTVLMDHPFFPNDPERKIKTHYTPQNKPTELITRCPDMVTHESFGKENGNLACLLADEQEADESSGIPRYMYSGEDIIGADYDMRLIDKQIKSNPNNYAMHLGQAAFALVLGANPGEDYYFSGLTSLAAADSETGNLKGWDAVEFFEAPAYRDDFQYGKISATTFKKGKDIVIAYRGTDLSDPVDWLGIDMLGFGLNNNTRHDELARMYAARVAKAYNSSSDGEKYNIYTTGHSLGGYLAQIAAAELLQIQSDNSVKNPYNLTRVVYFNGMGLFSSKKAMNNSSNNQITTRDKLTAFNLAPDGTKDDKILLVHTFGDPVGLLGSHYAQHKEIKIADCIVKEQNAYYKLASGSANDAVCNSPGGVTNDILKIICEKVNSTEWIERNRNSVGSVLNAAKFLFDNALGGNGDISQVNDSVEEQYARGLPFNGVMPFMMSVHKTNNFFYTKYYHDMYEKMLERSPETKKYGPDSVTEIVSEPVVGSLASIDASDSPTINFGQYGSPLCTFESDYNRTHSTVFPAKLGQDFDSIYLKPGETITGRILCYSRFGFKDTEIVNNIDIAYKDDSSLTGIEALRVASVGVRDGGSEGKQLREGDPTSYYWDVDIVPRKKFFNRDKIREGKVELLYLAKGAITAGNDVSNENVPFEYIIETTNKNVQSPSIKSPSQALPGGTEPSMANPVCSIKTPDNVKATIWPIYSQSATISCVSNTVMVDSKITKRDILVNPSLKIGEVSSASMKMKNGKYYYEWDVKFRGVRLKLGNATIGLKSRALATRTWTSTGVVSNSINVHR